MYAFIYLCISQSLPAFTTTITVTDDKWQRKCNKLYLQGISGYRKHLVYDRICSEYHMYLTTYFYNDKSALVYIRAWFRTGDRSYYLYQYYYVINRILLYIYTTGKNM